MKPRTLNPKPAVIKETAVRSKPANGSTPSGRKCLGLTVESLRFKVSGLKGGLRVWGLGFRAQAIGASGLVVAEADNPRPCPKTPRPMQPQLTGCKEGVREHIIQGFRGLGVRV